MWGVSISSTKVFSVPNMSQNFPSNPNTKQNSPSDQQQFSVVMSKSERDEIQEIFKHHMTIHYAAGAGYKLTGVIQGQMHAYILSKGSTFKWDTCGPHAILMALGGGMVSYHSLDNLKLPLTSENCLDFQLVYNLSDDKNSIGANKWSNSNGLIAYRSLDDLEQILKIVQKK